MGRLIDADAIVEYVRKYSPISDGADLLETWLEYAPTVDATPCDVCRYSPPSSGDGKPCTMCPAEGKGGDTDGV